MMPATTKIKLLLTDIDGVWTDAGMYYDQQGNEWKKFNTYDSAGVIWCRQYNIAMGVITGEDTEIVKRRCAKLQVQHLFLGIKDKLQVAKALCDQLGFGLHETAYIGDDINDISLLQAVGFSACPASAPQYIKGLVKLVTAKKGGEGAFREFVGHVVTTVNGEAGLDPALFR